MANEKLSNHQEHHDAHAPILHQYTHVHGKTLLSLKAPTDKDEILLV